jgi:hypothetical protein
VNPLPGTDQIKAYPQSRTPFSHTQKKKKKENSTHDHGEDRIVMAKYIPFGGDVDDD